MASLLSNLLDNLAKGIHGIKSKYGYDNKKNAKHVELNTKFSACLENTKVKEDLIVYKCLCCNRNCQKNFDENLKKRI